MAKSKSFRTLKTSETGAELIFDYLAFKRIVSDRAARYEREYNQKRGGKSAIIKEIGKALCPGNPDSYIPSIKQWLSGYNSPSRVEDVEKMEEYLHIQLLTERESCQQLKSEKQGDESVNCECKCSVRYLEKESSFIREREAAKAVYDLLADLIRAHKKLMINYLHADFPISLLSSDYSFVPEDYPIYADLNNEIRKIGFDLPREIQENALQFLYGLYGYNMHYERIDETFDMSMEVDTYEHYVKERWHQEAGGSDKLYWYEFTCDMEEEYYQELDDIFEKYLID